MIKLAEFAKRRQQLIRALGDGNIAIIAAAPECIRNGDVHYAYRQNSNFYYLTGFPEPEAIAVFVPGCSQGEYILFNRPRDTSAEIWNGKRAGQEGARENYGADQSYPIQEFGKVIAELLQNRKQLYYTMGSHLSLDEQLLACVNEIRGKPRTGIAAPTVFVDLAALIHEMRLFKSTAEITLMREAAKISGKAHCRAMQICQPGMMEYQLEAEIAHEFIRSGSRTPAYESIVGGGANSCVLHYRDNSEKLRDGDMVLIDAGCEYHCYASDVTRTFPVNGRFSPEQRAIYECVLTAQLAAIDLVRPGTRWDKIQQTVVRILTKGLVALGLLQGNVEKLIKKQAYHQFYMHQFGHWLGMDVHDVGSYRINNTWRPLEPGMVLTVEPGIYIAPHTQGVAEKWWNIGVRIEDDVLVIADGCEVLSTNAPKTVAEIEQMMAVS